MKENVWRAKRLTREMLTYWKRYDRNERETRKKQEKEAEEQRKMDVELMEASTNFVLTPSDPVYIVAPMCVVIFLVRMSRIT